MNKVSKVEQKKLTTLTFFKYKTHSVAGVLEEYDITTLKASIKDHGLFQPVLLWYDKVTRKWYLVDGRHRVKAWYELYDTDIPIHRLDKSTTEEDLPKVILEAQIIGRGLDVICANCEATLYLKNNGKTAAELERTYDIIDRKKIQYLKTILDVRPIWFRTLRNGDFVDTGDGSPTKSLGRLSSLCIAERDGITTVGKDKESNPSVAEAFSKAKPHVDAILSLIDGDDIMLYAVEQLIRQGTIDIDHHYHITVPERQIQELEQEVKTINNLNKELINHSTQVEAELDDFKQMYLEHRLSENVDEIDCNIERN